MTDRTYESHRIEWRGIEIEIRYCADWVPGFERSYGHTLAHIEIEAVDPARVKLPITETGYRSHFTSAEEIAEAGGPVPYVRDALDEAAESRGWKDYEEASRQMSLL